MTARNINRIQLFDIQRTYTVVVSVLDFFCNVTEGKKRDEVREIRKSNYTVMISLFTDKKSHTLFKVQISF